MTRTQPMHLSFSSLNTAASCRRSFYSRYVLQRKTPPGDAANFGRRFEEALAAELRATPCPAAHRVERDDPKPVPEVLNPDARQIVEMSNAVDAAEERLQSEIRRGIEVYKSTLDTLVPAGMELCSSDGKVLVPASGRSLLAQKEVWMEPGQWEVLADFYGVRSSIHLPFLGYIDFLETSGPAGLVRKVVDLKTSSRKGFQLSWALQTTLYALYERAQTCEAHLVVRPQPKLDADGNPVQAKKPAQFRAFVYRFAPSAETFRWAMQWVSEWASVIRRDCEADCIESLPATPGYFCAFCPENAACEAYLLSKLTALGGEAEE